MEYHLTRLAILPCFELIFVPIDVIRFTVTPPINTMVQGAHVHSAVKVEVGLSQAGFGDCSHISAETASTPQ